MKKPIFKVIDIENSKTYSIYEDGRTTGFPENSIVINEYPERMSLKKAQLKNKLAEAYKKLSEKEKEESDKRKKKDLKYIPKYDIGDKVWSVDPSMKSISKKKIWGIKIVDVGINSNMDPVRYTCVGEHRWDIESRFYETPEEALTAMKEQRKGD